MAEPAEDAEQLLRQELDCPREDGELYEARGEEVDDLRPVCQGDVYEGLTLPGYELGDHEMVMLSQHPCSLRSGAALRPRIQALPVRRHQYLPPRSWSGHGKVFPLPALEDKEHLAADLSEAGMVTREQLASARRTITLSRRAILLLQQRIVWTAAHTIVGLDTFEEFNAPALEEIELLEGWNELLCGELEGAERAAALETTAQQFEAYIREEGLQDALAQTDRRSDARRTIRMEAIRRREVRDT
ncbi:MAG: hypothetical protein ACRDK7_11200 [Solirubrobacteraceae bacterium]